MLRKLCDYFLKCALLPLLVLGLVFYLALRPGKPDAAPALTENPPNRYEHLWLVNGDPWLLTSDGTLMRMGNGMPTITLPASRADYCIEGDAWQELYLQATLYDTDFPAQRLFCTDGTKYAIATEYHWTQGRLR